MRAVINLVVLSIPAMDLMCLPVIETRAPSSVLSSADFEMNRLKVVPITKLTRL